MKFAASSAVACCAAADLSGAVGQARGRWRAPLASPSRPELKMSPSGWQPCPALPSRATPGPRRFRRCLCKDLDVARTSCRRGARRCCVRNQGLSLVDALPVALPASQRPSWPDGRKAFGKAVPRCRAAAVPRGADLIIVCLCVQAAPTAPPRCLCTRHGRGAVAGCPAGPAGPARWRAGATRARARGSRQWRRAGTKDRGWGFC